MQSIEPRLHWNDLQVSNANRTVLRKIAAESHSTAGEVLFFYGADKAAKARAVEVLATEMHRALYRVDLSKVISKFIGETEKNLDGVFLSVTAAQVILYFDEADALFGNRTDATSSRDRYANADLSNLLHRLEQFGGLAILATNQPLKIDRAFLRRVHYSVEFAPTAN